jgi:hypothetical protein
MDSLPHLNLTPEHAQRVAPRVRALRQLAQIEAGIEITEAYAAGRAVGATEHWLRGAKVGAFCGLIAGLGSGAGGAIAFVYLGRAFV